MNGISVLFPSQLSKNFHAKEVIDASTFQGSWFPFDHKLIAIAQYLRDQIGSPIKINSAYRSPEHNASVGGAKHSQHIEGNAIDLSGDGLVEFVENAYRNKTADWYRLVDLGVNGLGIYNSFIHLDTRPGGFAFWSKKKSDIQGISVWILAGIIALLTFLKSLIK